MNVLFFCHEDFTCNSMGHIAGFAKGLRALGHACAVAIPGDDRSSVEALGEAPPFHPAVFADTWEHGSELFPDHRPADLIHAWTPREHVRRAVEHCLLGMPHAQLVVHLEDNEEHLAACFTGVKYERLRELTDEELATRLPAHLSHPRGYLHFLHSAKGVTGIIQTLAEFTRPDIPFVELWPGVDFSLYHPGPPDEALRASLGIRPEEKILCYTGNSHFSNGDEMQSLYEAVFALNRLGRPCRLIRTGYDTPEFLGRFAPDALAKYVVHLGFVERVRLPGLLRLADVLVQPGGDDAFNRYRLPSKLPEFFASGRPVIAPRTNIGLHARPEREVLTLETRGPEAIVTQCQRVFTDQKLAKCLAVEGAAFARRHFDPEVNARKLEQFYRRLVRPTRGIWQRVWQTVKSGQRRAARRRTCGRTTSTPPHFATM